MSNDVKAGTADSTKEPVKINYELLKKQVEEGKKKDELAKIYGLSVLQMGNVLKECGLKIRKFHKPKYIIEGLPDTIDDKPTPTQELTESEKSTEELLEETDSKQEEIVDVEEKPEWD